MSGVDLHTHTTASDGTYTLVLSPATGTFSGTFVHELDEGVPNPARTTFQGVIYQQGNIAGGRGFFLTRSPAVLDFTGKSGAVEWVGN